MGSVVGGSLGGHGDVRNDGPIDATGLDPTQKLAAGWGFSLRVASHRGFEGLSAWLGPLVGCFSDSGGGGERR